MNVEHNAIRNEVIELLLDQIEPNKKGHLIIDGPKHSIFRELQQSGYLDVLEIHGSVVDVAYNYKLLRFFNRGLQA